SVLFHPPAPLRTLHAFPTRRSSDLLRLEHGSIGWRAVRFAHAAAADFVLRDLADRILRRDGQSVRTFFAGPVIRDEYRVRPNRRDRKSTRLNSSHRTNSYAVFCLKK